MQGRQNDALLILAECYQSFESSKKRKVRSAFCAKQESGPAVCFRK